MAKSESPEVAVSFGVEQSARMRAKLKSKARSKKQLEKSKKRVDIATFRAAHEKVFSSVFGLRESIVVPNSNDPTITYFTEQYRLESSKKRTYDHSEERVGSVNIGLIGAAIYNRNPPSLVEGVDIEKSEFEQEIVVAAAMRKLISPTLDTDEDDRDCLIHGLYVPDSQLEPITVEQFNSEAEIKSHERWQNRGNREGYNAADLDSGDAREALKVIKALAEATQAAPPEVDLSYLYAE